MRGRLVCVASRREKAMVLLSGMVTRTGAEGGGRSAEAGEACCTAGEEGAGGRGGVA